MFVVVGCPSALALRASPFPAAKGGLSVSSWWRGHPEPTGGRTTIKVQKEGSAMKIKEILKEFKEEIKELYAN